MEKLDSELLRTFQAVAHTGSMTEGAERIHRSQSATSIQIKRLEDIVGHPVFERHGRGVILSDVGQKLLPLAGEVISRLDAALREISNTTVNGKIKLGIPDDYERAKLTKIIADFSRKHPGVELDVTCALSAEYPKALNSGDLDLAVYEVENPTPHEELLAEEPTCWVASRDRDFSKTPELPVALFDQACWWRDAAIASLQSRGKPYRVIYSSQSVSGVIAAVEAGIAVGLVGRSSIHSGLAVVDRSIGLQPTPTSKLVIAASDSKNNDAIDAMKSSIRRAFVGGGA